MTVLKRRLRGDRLDGVGEAHDQAPASDIAVAAFEYVKVEDTALARLTGTWSAERDAPVDMVLSVEPPTGGRQEFSGTAKSSARARAHLERTLWQVTFTIPVALIHEPAQSVHLEAEGRSLTLPRPELHETASPRDPAGAAEAPREERTLDVGALEGRVRQAEAAIGWTQKQLTRERDSRKAAEEELAIARPELEARRRELERVAALEASFDELTAERDRLAPLEAQVAELIAERDRLAPLEAQVAELTVERDQLAPLEARVTELSAEHAKRVELEVRMEELAAQRDRLLPLEAQVEELGSERDRLASEIGELTAERDRLAPLEPRVEELTAERDRLASLAAAQRRA